MLDRKTNDEHESSSSSSSGDSDDDEPQAAAASQKEKKWSRRRIKEFERKHRTARWRYRLPAGFPSTEAMEAYEKPKVATLAELAKRPETTGVGRAAKRNAFESLGEDEDAGPRPANPRTFFRWREPDEEAVARWCEHTLGWADEKIEREVMPALRKHEERRGKPRTTRLDAFYETYTTNKRFAEVKSKRLRRAFGMAVQQSDDDSDDGEKTKAKKKTTKKTTSDGEKTQGKKKKDPAAPKGKVSAFLYFSKEKRAEVKAALPSDVKPTDVSRELGKRWRDLGDAEKEPYTELASQDAARYDRDMADYRRRELPFDDDDDEQDDDDDDDEDDLEPPPTRRASSRDAAAAASHKIRRVIQPLSDDDEDDDDGSARCSSSSE